MMYFECNKDRDVEGSSWKPKTSKDHVYASELMDGLIVKVSISAAHLVSQRVELYPNSQVDHSNHHDHNDP